jgi:hypothetical protein
VSEFVFMLTHDDATVANARDVLAGLTSSGLRYVGFKDVGASPAALGELVQLAHRADMEVMLEIVTTSAADEIATLRSAVDIGVDWVLGGTHPDQGAEILRDTGIRYCPFPGVVVGHPSVLEGSLEEIAEDARRLGQTGGVHGLDLLAYRHRTVDPIVLTRAVVEAIAGPVIVAGSIASADQITDVDDAGAWGFTIGGAIFDGLLPGGGSVPGQVAAVLELTRGTGRTGIGAALG